MLNAVNSVFLVMMVHLFWCYGHFVIVMHCSVIIDCLPSSTFCVWLRHLVYTYIEAQGMKGIATVKQYEKS